MAYTLSYLESNGIKVTAGDTNFLTVNVYKMKSDYTYELLVEDQVIAIDNYYNIGYAADGVYKITVKESATTFSYADINYCSMLGKFGISLKDHLCCEAKCNVVDYNDPVNLMILGQRYWAELTYTIFSTTDFTSAIAIADLRGIRDAIERSHLYGANIIESSCC